MYISHPDCTSMRTQRMAESSSLANLLNTYIWISCEIDETATNFWQSFMQIHMSSRAVVELPQNPLSLLPYEEPSFYVRPVYYRLWDIISTQTGTCAADRHFETCISCCSLTFIFCNASQSCSSASCPSGHKKLYFCRPNPHNRNSRGWQNQHALVYVVEACQNRF